MTNNFMNDLFSRICDYNQEITEEDLDKIYTHFEVDLEHRKPAPAYTQSGDFQGTDLDLASFLSAIARRGAVINIPEYKAMRGTTTRENQYVISDKSRHGKLTGMYSNQEVFSFGIKIIDNNVVTRNPDGSESVGFPRKFTLINSEGEWYNGWKTINWRPDDKENDFLTKNKLWTDNKIIFTHFVHPALARSIFGMPYRVVKALIARQKAEASYLNSKVKELKEKGFELEGIASFDYGEETRAETKPIVVQAFESLLDAPFIGNISIPVEESNQGLKYAYEKRKKLVYTITPNLSFIARSIEYAYVKFGQTMNVPEYVLSKQWDKGVKLTPKARTLYERLRLDNNVYLLKRFYNKTEQVSVD